MMARANTLSMATSLAVTVGLTLAALGPFGPQELPVPDRQVTGSVGSERPDARLQRALGTESVPAPGSTLRTDPGRTASPVPSPRPPVELYPQVSAPPALVHVGGIDVVAPVVQVGLRSDGGMVIPTDVMTVGWFAVEGHRIIPGEPGTAVLAGHRDSRSDGPGVLHALADVTVGEVIRITHVDGSVSAWQVVELMMTPRDALPVAELFTASGTPRLAMVTCGGTFDLLRRHYTHNTIVIAHHVSPGAT